MMDILAIISSYLPSLSKSEQKVAQYVLSNSDEVVNLSVNELALLSEVGESTIVRFTRKIGFGGFQDFKKELLRFESVQTKVDANLRDTPEDITYAQLLKSLNETKGFINEELIKQAAQLLSQARKIYLFAVGTSGITAQHVSNRLKRLGQTVDYVQDSHLQSINATLTKKEDVVLAISTSGNTKDVQQCIQLAQQNGTKIVTITNYLKSAISQLGDLSLTASSKEFPSDSGSFSATINQLYLVDVLTKYMIEQDPNYFHTIRQQTNHALIKRI